MKYYQLTEDGSYVCDGKTIPPQNLTPITITETDEDGNEIEVELPAPVHYLYANMMAEVESGDAEILPYVPAPLSESDYSTAIQSHLDAEAKKLGYDSIFSAVTYADEPEVSKFQQEGKALRSWRSLVWARSYEIMGGVKSGAIAQPTVEELMAEIYKLPSPALEPET